MSVQKMHCKDDNLCPYWPIFYICWLIRTLASLWFPLQDISIEYWIIADNKVQGKHEFMIQVLFSKITFTNDCYFVIPIF